MLMHCYAPSADATVVYSIWDNKSEIVRKVQLDPSYTLEYSLSQIWHLNVYEGVLVIIVIKMKHNSYTGWMKISTWSKL